MGKTYRIGQLAEMCQVSKRTIDYYTNLGLLQTVDSPRRSRYYDESAIESLKLIEHYKNNHLVLSEIKERLTVLRSSRTDGKLVLQKMDSIEGLLGKLEEEVLQLKPHLHSVDEDQYEALKSQLAAKGMALAKILALLSQGNLML
ncbi:MerR family transcriptional regulator [Metabacillus sp. GX 13764]|uniref:MerR family transcriptional regulator n=1 Tax=Metabacillus kandeliae TaxID=2900151 RepID=UPI001E463D8C|nr:MerR family transcriptional regulator [Metabacillus kandeliae]MCD7033218.1 MerR family transcriptional regulator [Metabacillus kandeliae]